MKVKYQIFPEEYYHEKLSSNVRKFGGPDAFMVGPYYIWEYAYKGTIQDLDSLLNQPDITDPDYDIDDFYPNVLDALKWDKVPGHKAGTGSLWGVPMGFEIHTLAYNKRIFKEKGLEAPETMEQLLELCKTLNKFDGEGTYALAVRGAINWATINTGFNTTYANYGAKDFEVVNGKLEARVNSEQAVAMTDMWVELIRAGGPPEWKNYTWYRATADFGAGKAAMLFDADITAYYQNPPGESEESGNIAWTKAPVPEGRERSEANLWSWGLSISSFSEHKKAAWIFLQYFTSKEYTLDASQNFKVINPARKSVLESPEFQRVISKADGYNEVLRDTIDHAVVQFTPQPYFFEISIEWSKALQGIVSGKYGTQEGLDKLKVKIDKIVNNVDAE
ncbi:MAG: ABC transporter substrate-binding protein [Acetivibrionales bacterium]